MGHHTGGARGLALGRAVARQDEREGRGDASRRRGRGFTLVELMLVMVLIALLLALLIPEIPVLINFHKSMLARSFVQTLSDACFEYHRVYGDYPYDGAKMHDPNHKPCLKFDRHMINCETDRHGLSGRDWTDLDVCHYGNASGYTSLYLMLQGPEGAGWRPNTDYPRVKEFGPLPENPGKLGIEPATGEKYFVDPFNRPVLYYKARVGYHENISGTLPDGRVNYSPRYWWLHNQYVWESRTFQSGADEGQAWPHEFYMYRDGNHSRHWRKRLTRRVEGPLMLPHNPETFIIWTAGGDMKFGYWVWSDEDEGYVVDRDPDNDADKVLGRCDDITNFL